VAGGATFHFGTADRRRALCRKNLRGEKNAEERRLKAAIKLVKLSRLEIGIDRRGMCHGVMEL
jgi:hypothetical protein